MTEQMSGQVAIVTGANSGIGREVALGLAHQGAAVVLACRNPERAQTALQHIRAQSGNEGVETMCVDLSLQRSIRAFVEQFRAKHDRLDVLVNNAAIWPQERQLTEEGIEVTWATNVLGYFVLTDGLRELLESSAPSRVINVASRFARDLDLDDVQFNRRAFNTVAAYAQSKQAVRMFTWALAKRLEGTGGTANAVHPGVTRTGLLHQQRGVVGAIMSGGLKLLGHPPSHGADTILWLATDPACADYHGKFWMNRREIRCRFRDPAQAEALWSRCSAMSAEARS